MNITSRIFDVIAQKRISQTDLAQALGITKNNISEWKSGNSAPSPKIILKLLFHFPDIDANWLIRGEVQQNTSQTQTIRGNYNHQAGTHIITEPSVYELENRHLKQIIAEKEEQIVLLKELLKK